jgi:hypothetical protein
MGQSIDASIVRVPMQRSERKSAIKKGAALEDWKGVKKRQKIPLPAGPRKIVEDLKHHHDYW